MITIPDLTDEFVRKTPFLEEGLNMGILNLSAVARMIRPYIEKKTLKKVKTGAIVMALKRLRKKELQEHPVLSRISGNLGEITVRSKLMEFTFINSTTLSQNHEKLLKEISSSRESFVTVTQGIYETTLIVSDKLYGVTEKIFSGEKLLKKIENLSAITIRLPQNAVYVPGVHYNILKALAWEGIPIVESVSTYTEFTVILENRFLDRAFSILQKFTSGVE